MFPSGRHYFAVCKPSDGIKEQDPELAQLVEAFVGSPDSRRRSLPAKPLAAETTDVWLQKWLSTALFSEVAQGDFEQFWRRLSRSRKRGANDEGKLLSEAKRVWLKSQKVSLALDEMSLGNRLKSVI